MKPYLALRTAGNVPPSHQGPPRPQGQPAQPSRAGTTGTLAGNGLHTQEQQAKKIKEAYQERLIIYLYVKTCSRFPTPLGILSDVRDFNGVEGEQQNLDTISTNQMLLPFLLIFLKLPFSFQSISNKQF